MQRDKQAIWWTIAVVAMLLYAAFLSSRCPAIEVKPHDPQVYDLVSIKYAEGSFIQLQSIRNGELYFPQVREISPTELIWTGPPGTYWITGREAGKRVQERVTIGGREPEPLPPPPGPDEDEGAEPDEQLEDTTYDVGPQMRQIVPADKRKAVSDVFHLAARTANRRGGDLQKYADEILSKLRPHLTEEQLQAYGSLFDSQLQAGVIVTMPNHIGAWSEVAMWLDK